MTWLVSVGRHRWRVTGDVALRRLLADLRAARPGEVVAIEAVA